MLDMSKDQIADEIVGARSELAGCGVPESSIRGFRAPYLDTKPEVSRSVCCGRGGLPSVLAHHLLS